MSAFGNAMRLAAWAGVCPANHESAGKQEAARHAAATSTSRRPW